MSERTQRVFVAGHRGLVGSAIVRRLRAAGGAELILKTRAELDLRDGAAVHGFFRRERIDCVYLAAAKVGGILANARSPADFLYENLAIATNVVHAAAQTGVAKLLFVGSSCLYPRLAPQPIREEALLTASLEPTNEAYAIAKIAGLKLCEYYQRQYGKRFIAAMPCNLYGPGDNFDPTGSHVIPGLLRRYHEAREGGLPEVAVWGTGKPLREFLHADDLAEALWLLMERYEAPEPINVGSGAEVSIADLAGMIASVVGYRGRVVFDASKPDGTPRKVLDSGRIRALGWAPRVPLREGLAGAYRWAVEAGVLRGDEPGAANDGSRSRP